MERAAAKRTEQIKVARVEAELKAARKRKAK
jgi:hypothetical protein